MRIVQLTTTSSGGVARHAQRITDLLRSVPGHEVMMAGPHDVVAGVGGPTAVIDIADRPRLSDLSATWRLRRLLRGVDVVHAHGLRAGAVAVLASRGQRRRPMVVVTVHNLPVGGSRVRYIARLLEFIVARGGDVVLGVSGDLVARMRSRGARCAARALVPAPTRAAAESGADPDRVRRELGIRGDELMVLTVARLAPQKGLDLLVAAASALAQNAVPFRWVVVGDGPLQAWLENEVRERAIPVRVAGRRSDIAELLKASDLVVSTSAWEGQPLAVQEALLAGAPIVATDVGGTGEVTGEAALLVPFDTERLSDAVRVVLADSDRRAEMSRASTARAVELPSESEVMSQLQEIYARR